MGYSEKLKDPRWQKLRLKVFERDNWECQWCGNREITLVAHHLYYENNKDPWEYPDEAFLTLCQPCHQFNHEQRHIAETELVAALRWKGFSPTDVMSMAKCFQTAGDNTMRPSVMTLFVEYLLTDKDVQSKVFPVIEEHIRKVLADKNA